MKHIIFCIVLCVSTTAYSQQETVTIPKLEYIAAAQSIRSLRDTVSTLKMELTLLRNKIVILQNMIDNSNQQANLMQKESELYMSMISHYDNYFDTAILSIKPKWYETKEVWLLGGVGLTYLVSVILNNIR